KTDEHVRGGKKCNKRESERVCCLALQQFRDGVQSKSNPCPGWRKVVTASIRLGAEIIISLRVDALVFCHQSGDGFPGAVITLRLRKDSYGKLSCCQFCENRKDNRGD